MTTRTQPTNWSGTVAYRARRVHAPTSVQELQALVARSPRIRALGTRHSFNEVADTTADLVSLASMPPVVDVDRAASTVTVAAGVRYGALATAVQDAGLALRNMGSLPHISVGGACATGTHGSGVGNGNLASSVRALRLVTADGDLVTLSRDDDPERFPGVVVALGALGVVVDLTLDLVPTYDVRQVVYEGLPPEQLVDGTFGEVLAGGYSVSLFTRWRSPGVDQVWLKRAVRPSSAGRREGQPGDLPDDAAGDYPPTWRGARLADGPRHPLPGMPTENCTPQQGVVGPWNERLPHFRMEFTPSSGDEIQSEYFVPAEHAAAAMAALAPIRDRIARVLHVSEIRTVRADDLWLSGSHERDSVALHFTWQKDPTGVGAVLPEVEDLLAPFGPRPHWGKVFTIDPGAVRAQYPRADDFAALAASMDPGGKFRNEFLDRYLPAP
ncbi:FAD-binding protein [Cellulomonas aerilata]|uniref:FAD-binding protein n=1 Tax=Cellulomonas aerilata TaxID=515326 RepID=A0A512D7Y7_9CELL|nr:FAD-binding protein [Cellulomonas aerilata]GEO32505.1 FAD-binding protein [Cellulomonas aerilata]